MTGLADELAFFADDFLRTLLDFLLLHRFVCFGDLVLHWLLFSGRSVFCGLLDDSFGLGALGSSFDEETLDLRRFLADSTSEEVKFGAPDVSLLHYLDFGDGGCLDGKNFLDADVVGGDFSDDK